MIARVWRGATRPEDAEAYREFVLEVARSVADAASGGDESESEAIAKVQAALKGG